MATTVCVSLTYSEANLFISSRQPFSSRREEVQCQCAAPRVICECDRVRCFVTVIPVSCHGPCLWLRCSLRLPSLTEPGTPTRFVSAIPAKYTAARHDTAEPGTKRRALLAKKRAPGQRHWLCTDRGDRSGAELKCGVLREASTKWGALGHPGGNDVVVRKIVYSQPRAILRIRYSRYVE